MTAAAMNSGAEAIPQPAGSPAQQPEFWFDRYDVGEFRGFEPEVSSPRHGDGALKRVAAATDLALVRSLSAVMLTSSVPSMARGLRDPLDVTASWDFYSHKSFLAEPNRFFRAPQAVEPERSPARKATFRPRDGDVFDLSFDSQYAPLNLATRAKYLSHSANDRAHARMWRHRGGPRPTVVCVHGYILSGHSLNSEIFNIRWLYKRGMNVMLFHLPFHGERRAVFSGLGFPDFDLARLAEGMGQAVHDLRILIDWLLDAGTPMLGLAGASLGAYFSSLMSCIDERIDFLVPMIPATSLSDIVADWSPANLVLKALQRHVGWDDDDLRRFGAVHNALQHAPLLPSERIFMICGAADRVTRPYQAQMLWEHLDRPEISWFAGSHIVHPDRRPYLRRLGRFLGGLGAFDARTERDSLAASGEIAF